jgi:phenylacetate 2-hydroxylase
MPSTAFNVIVLMGHSFRSTNSNAQDFIPHLRYLPGSGRTATALEVRERRDKWLAAMLDKVRDTLTLRTGPKKCVAEMLLTDKQEGLTKRMCCKCHLLMSRRH